MPRVSESLQEYAARIGQSVTAAYPQWHLATLRDNRPGLGLTQDDVKAVERYPARAW